MSFQITSDRLQSEAEVKSHLQFGTAKIIFFFSFSKKYIL